MCVAPDICAATPRPASNVQYMCVGVARPEATALLQTRQYGAARSGQVRMATHATAQLAALFQPRGFCVMINTTYGKLTFDRIIVHCQHTMVFLFQVQCVSTQTTAGMMCGRNRCGCSTTLLVTPDTSLEAVPTRAYQPVQHRWQRLRHCVKGLPPSSERRILMVGISIRR